MSPPGGEYIGHGKRKTFPYESTEFGLVTLRTFLFI